MTSFSLSQAFCPCSVWSHLPCLATLIMLWICLNQYLTVPTVHLCLDQSVSSFCFLAWVPLCVCLLPNPSVISPLYLLQLRCKMEHLPRLIRLSHNRAPVSQSTGHRAAQPIPITGIRPINNLIQDVRLSYPSLFLISLSGKVIPAAITPTRPITWRTDKIWGLGSCHSSVDVWMTVLPRKVHTHDWGCMGLILLHSPLCLWSVWGRKRGLLIEGKTWLQGRRMGEGIAPECFWWFLHVACEYSDISLLLLSQNNHLFWENKIWDCPRCFPLE